VLADDGIIDPIAVELATRTVPDWGDSGSLYQWIEVPEPGDTGHPMAELLEGDPWAAAANLGIHEIGADAGSPGGPVASRPDYLGSEPEPEAGS
jgi:hypothetical protein